MVRIESVHARVGFVRDAHSHATSSEAQVEDYVAERCSSASVFQKLFFHLSFAHFGYFLYRLPLIVFDFFVVVVLLVVVVRTDESSAGLIKLGAKRFQTLLFFCAVDGGH